MPTSVVSVRQTVHNAEFPALQRLRSEKCSFKILVFSYLEDKGGYKVIYYNLFIIAYIVFNKVEQRHALIKWNKIIFS